MNLKVNSDQQLSLAHDQEILKRGEAGRVGTKWIERDSH